jgi:hypothetical protein
LPELLQLLAWVLPKVRLLPALEPQARPFAPPLSFVF